jgi:hypothetical protein
MCYFQLCGHILQFAVAIGYAHRAGMVAFGMQQFCGYFLVFLYSIVGSGNGHVGHYFGSTGRHQFVVAFNLHQTNPAGAYIAQAIHMAHGEYFNIVFPANLQYGLSCIGFDGSTVYAYVNNVHKGNI